MKITPNGAAKGEFKSLNPILKTENLKNSIIDANFLS